jgi:hypothetical protein
MGGSDDSQIQIPKTTILPEFKGSEEEKEYVPGQGTWADLAKAWAIALIFCVVSFGLAQPILQVCSILFLIVICLATFNTFMHPEKYIVGNFVPGDTSDSDSNSESES